MKKCGLLLIHGIFTSAQDYDLPFQKSLFAQIKYLGKDPDDIAYQKVYWAEYLNIRQKQYYDDCLRNPLNIFGWNWARKFVLNGLADASAYEREYGEENKSYFNILRKIHTAVRAIRKALTSEDKPLIIAAHSLGGFIVSNYIWDCHKIRDGVSLGWPQDIMPQGPFEQMVNLAGIITFGCNIPLFVIGHDPIEAIRFPHPQLPATWKARAQWQNYYDPIDVLGSPLKDLPYSYDGIVKPSGKYAYSDVITSDHPIAVRGLNPFSWTPMSHVFYWTHWKFIRPVANQIAQFL